MNKSKKLRYGLYILFILFILITCVHAETITGTLSSTPSVVSITEVLGTSTYSTDTAYRSLHYIGIPNIQSSYGATAMIRYDYSTSYGISTDSGAPTGASTTFTAHLTNLGGATLFTGTIGYQRLFNPDGSERVGFQYVTFDSNYNQKIQGLTGDTIIYLDFNDNSLYHAYLKNCNNDNSFYYHTGHTAGIVGFYGYAPLSAATGLIMWGNCQTNYNKQFGNTYSVTKPSGLGIQGEIDKTYNGINFASWATVYDGSTGSLLATESSSNYNTYYFNTYASSIIIGVKDSLGIFHNTSVLFPSQITYNLVLSSYLLSPNQTVTATITSSTGDLSHLYFYKITDATPETPFPNFYDTHDSTNYHYAFNFLKNTSNYWNGFTETGYKYNFGTSMPNNQVLYFKAGGNRTLKLTTEDDQTGILTDYLVNLTVLGSGSLVLNAYPIDFITGNFVTGAIIHVQNRQDMTWENRTVNSPADCVFYKSIGFYDLSGSALGYTNQDNGLVYLSDSQKTVKVDMIPLSTSIGTNATCYLGVETEPNLYPLQGAVITVSGGDLSSNQMQITSMAGVGTFILTLNQTYQADISAQGYGSITAHFTVNANPYYLYMVTSVGNTPVTVETTIPTITNTPIPVETPLGYSSNTTCISGIATNNLSSLDQIKNSIACAGFTTGESQSWALACLCILFCAFILSSKGGSTGMIIGAVTGYIISLGLQLIPVWTLIAFIILAVAGLVYKGVLR